MVIWYIRQITTTYSLQTQVRPHLEYENAILHPQYIADIKNVEGVQRRAINVILELRDYSNIDLNLSWEDMHLVKEL